MSDTSTNADPSSQWHWNGEQWLWWNGSQWQEAGVGQAEASADTAVPAAMAGSTEPILSIIPNVALQAGFMGFGSRTYSLIITDRRIVFARLTSGLMSHLSKQEREQARDQGQGRMGQWSASFKAWDRLTELYVQRGPEALLAEDPHNFAIERADVTSVKLKTTGNGADSPEIDHLRITTPGKKFKLILSGGKASARAALQTAGLPVK